MPLRPRWTKEIYQSTAPWSSFSSIEERGSISITIDNVKYNIDGNIAVIAQQEQSLSGAIVIPEEVPYDGSTYSVTYIVDAAFSGTQIESITLPGSITVLSVGCFENCTALASIDLPNGITTIGERCFSGCTNLASIDLPDGITSIGMRCFSGCTALTSIDLPNGVTTIGERCFSGCTNLASIDLPQSLTSIGATHFENCHSLCSVYVHWASPVEVSAHENAFANISSEACLYIPNSTLNSYIYMMPWSNFSNIVEEESGVAFIDGIKYTLSDDGTAVIARQEQPLTGAIEIPVEVTYDGSTFYRVTGTVVQAFYNNQIESISLPNGITSIGTGCFYGCTNLTSVNLPDDLIVLSERCFEDCTNLASIDFPESLRQMQGWCFRNCTSLASIDLPERIGIIGVGCFANCTNLRSVSCHWTSFDWLQVQGNAFDGVPLEEASLYVPPGTKEMYQATSPWSLFGNIVEREGIPVTIDNVKYNIDGNTAIIVQQEQSLSGAIVIPEEVPHDGSTYRVTGIVDAAFSGTQIESISLPVGITTIGDNCFYHCTNLTSVDLPESLTTIGERCFAACTNLCSVSCHWTSFDWLQVQVNAFDGVPLEEASLYVPTGTKEMYQATAPWSSFGKILERDGSGSSISIQLETSLTVEQSGYEIAVSGAESGASVALYNIGGTLIGSSTADSEGSARIATGGATGVVIIRAGSKSAKVMLK